MKPTRHCFRCGWVWQLSGQPGRSDSCHDCGADLKVCLNCIHYDRSVAHECRERRAEPVAKKDDANFCEYFEMKKRAFVKNTEGDSREDAARNSLKKLFGD